jgi:hypothetical protein
MQANDRASLLDSIPSHDKDRFCFIRLWLLSPPISIKPTATERKDDEFEFDF